KVLGSNGVTRSAERNGEFRQGDSIVTGSNSLAQLRMSDGGAVSVRADTQLKLEGYRFLGPEDRESNFAVSILKGGFRALTGLIGRNNRQNVRISTSSMTLGVRGTDFEVVHVLQPMPDVPAGTYNRVYDGAITVQNRAGASIVVNPGQTVFVALPSNRPPVMVAPPVGIFGKPTPAPQPAPVSSRGELPAEGAKPAAPAARGTSPVQTVAPARIQSAPLLNPIDTPRVMEVSPALTAPATSTILSPTTTTISPTLTAPATSTISPATISPTTTTISPTLTAPATSTLSPTVISPTTTTISPVLTAPTTISPTLTAPTTSTISPTVISPTTTTISPTLTAPTTISPTLTAPTTTIQQTAPIIKR
ncbi:MAG TPA: FecR domain-containing protein, partial [Burkholderiales bacterium]|nr:FecR domain-containing protein [Burkholderiales bacterium]